MHRISVSKAFIFDHKRDMEHISRTSKFWLPWLVGMPAETTTAICCLIMGNVMVQFPRLKFCFAHGGGAFPFTVGRIQHGYDCRPDLVATDCVIPPKEFLGKFYTDSLVHSKTSLDLLIEIIGKVRVYWLIGLLREFFMHDSFFCEG